MDLFHLVTKLMVRERELSVIFAGFIISAGAPRVDSTLRKILLALVQMCNASSLFWKGLFSTSGNDANFEGGFGNITSMKTIKVIQIIMVAEQK